MRRPILDECTDMVDYVFRLNVYVNDLEQAAKTLRRGISYAQEIIPTEIPNFEQMLRDTAWIETPKNGGTYGNEKESTDDTTEGSERTD